MEYKIKKTNLKEIEINSPEWDNAEVASIAHKEWADFPESPNTTVRVLTNGDGLFVKFESDEKYVLAECDQVNGDVFKESCVEFFVKPDPENNDNYFNFELNAKGTPHIGFGTGRSPARYRIPDLKPEIFKIESVMKEQGFILKLYIPYSFFLERVDNIGEYFMGNFQKCKEKEPEPHFATYYPIKTPNPDFHRPEFFGKLIIE